MKPRLQSKNVLTTKQLILTEPHEWLGDWHPLAEQLGSTNGLLTLASVSIEMPSPGII